MYNDEKWFGIVGAMAIVSDIIEARRDWAEEAAE